MNALFFDKPPRVTIVIEWENALNAEAQRAYRALAELNVQLNQNRIVEQPIEVLIGVNPLLVAANELQQRIAEHLIPFEERYTWQLFELREANYYRIKNAGIANATGDIIIFLDSDVIPQPGWFKEMLEPFSRLDIQVLGGTTFIDYSDNRIYSKAFALGWFLDPIPNTRELLKTGRVWANNIAFRRDVLEKHQFTEVAHTARGGDSLLISRLQQEGIPVYRNTAALTSHPAPLPRNFIARALVQGRDDFTILRKIQTEKLPTVRRPSIKSKISNKAQQMLKNSRAIGISISELPFVIGIIAFFYLIYAIGYFGVQVAPSIFNRLEL